MKMNKKSLHKSRMRQKKMIDEKNSPQYTPTLKTPIDISPTRTQNDEFSKNYHNTYKNNVDIGYFDML